MKKILTFVCLWGLLAAGVFVNSCIEDKGNYEYVEVSKALFENGETQMTQAENVQVVPNGILHIEPVISYTPGLGYGDYKYEWHLYDVSYYTIEILSSSDSPVLDVQLPPEMNKPGTYKVVFIVQNNVTGLKSKKYYEINVQNALQIGYVALSEKSDGVDMDMIALFRDTLTFYPNLLQTVGSEYPREGRKPLDILAFPDILAPTPYDMNGTRIKHSVFLLTDKSTDRVKPEDYSFIEGDYNVSKISMIPPKFVPETGIIAEKMAQYGNQYYYIYMNNNWFFASRQIMVYFFMDPVNTPYGTFNYYKAAPFMASSGVSAMLYDMDNHRFMQQRLFLTNLYSSKEVLSTHALTDNDGDPYKFNDAEYDLTYMGNIQAVAVTPLGFAVMKHRATGRNEVWTFGHDYSTSVKYDRYILPSSLNVEEIRHFAYHPTEPFLYCASENSVFVVSMTSSPSVADITSSVVPQGHKVSLFKTLYPKITNRVLFAAATYDPSKAIDECGTVRIFTADTYSGALNLARHPAAPTADGYQIDMEWSGFGKVAGFDYKTQ